MQIGNIFILFCEDIREELNGKVSYMGTLGSGLTIESLPTTLPKLCIGIGADVDGFGEADVSCELTSDIGLNLPPPFEAKVEPPETDTEFWNLRLNIVMTAVPVPKSGTISARLVINENEATAKLRLFKGEAAVEPISSETGHLN